MAMKKRSSRGATGPLHSRSRNRSCAKLPTIAVGAQARRDTLNPQESLQFRNLTQESPPSAAA